MFDIPTIRLVLQRKQLFGREAEKHWAEKHTAKKYLAKKYTAKRKLGKKAYCNRSSSKKIKPIVSWPDLPFYHYIAQNSKEKLWIFVSVIIEETLVLGVSYIRLVHARKLY